MIERIERIELEPVSATTFETSLDEPTLRRARLFRDGPCFWAPIDLVEYEVADGLVTFRYPQTTQACRAPESIEVDAFRVQPPHRPECLHRIVAELS